VWIPKRGKAVLVGAVAKRLAALIEEVAAALDVTIVALEIMPDHVHLLVSASSKWAPHQIVHRIKGFTSNVLRDEYPVLRKLPSLWTRSYWCATAGNVSSPTIRRYIESQTKKGHSPHRI
jgi:putative transposase